MTAKKNIIKDLRQEIKDLKEQLVNYRHGMACRERQFTRIAESHKDEIAIIDQHTNGLANILQYKFLKELAWMELCDDPASKLQHIKQTIRALKEIAEPSLWTNENE